MSFLDYIEKIRQKPEDQRYLVLFISTFLLVTLIVILWLTISFLPSLAEKQEKTSSIGPFTVIKDTFLNIYETIK